MSHVAWPFMLRRLCFQEEQLRRRRSRRAGVAASRPDPKVVVDSLSRLRATRQRTLDQKNVETITKLLRGYAHFDAAMKWVRAQKEQEEISTQDRDDTSAAK